MDGEGLTGEGNAGCLGWAGQGLVGIRGGHVHATHLGFDRDVEEGQARCGEDCGTREDAEEHEGSLSGERIGEAPPRWRPVAGTMLDCERVRCQT